MGEAYGKSFVWEKVGIKGFGRIGKRLLSY